MLIMNKRAIFLVGIILLFTALILGRKILWIRSAPIAASSSPSPAGRIPASPASLDSAQQAASNQSSQETGIDAAAYEHRRTQYIEKALAVGKSLNRPVKFYGQVLDQNNTPVSGVSVKFELSRFGNVVQPGLRPESKSLERTSDDAGRFSVTDEDGLALEVMLQPKQGYIFKPAALQVMVRDEGINKPAPTLSTEQSPYVFHAHKSSPTGTVIKGSIAFYECIPDGRPYVIKLKDKQIKAGITGGDLRISVQRPPGWRDQKDYAWSAEIQSIDMEMIESKDVFMYQAPEKGYVTAWNFAREANASNYTREANAKFYLKSRDGSRYGRIEIQIISDYREASGIIINYWINPTGSRNLE